MANECVPKDWRSCWSCLFKNVIETCSEYGNVLAPQLDASTPQL